MTAVQTPTGAEELIGRGRSGRVYRARQGPERAIARKVFGGDGAGKLVLYLLTGAPNPYLWCQDAIAAAACRRRILQVLVRYWFGPVLRLPATYGWRWNAEHRALELRSEFITGIHPPLRCEPLDGALDPIQHLSRKVMRPLQRHLRQAGFDGLVWQAGLSNPVAGNNFMLEGCDEGIPRWVWIDLESGVPAWFPINPLRLVSYYLPRSVAHGRPLFDDVDTGRLRRYVAEHRYALVQAVGATDYQHMLVEIEELDSRQRDWKSIRRAARSVRYHLSQERISAAQAQYYERRPIRWYARLAPRAAAAAAGKLWRLAGRGVRWLGRVRWLSVMRGAALFGLSQKFRTRMAHRLVSRRIGLWELRGCFGPAVAQRLRGELRSDVASEYITDLGMHIALKPVDWLVLGVLLGYQQLVLAGLVVISGGVIIRTAYTLGRSVQAAIRRQPLPWVALLFGLLPAVGSAAYAAQLLYTGERHRGLARFILYDAFATVGRRFPIWGGQDTLTEHFFNRLPDLWPRRRTPGNSD